MTNDFRGALTEQQEARLIRERLEQDLEGKPQKSRQFTRAADTLLRAWAIHYKSTDGKELRSATGFKGGSQLGRAMKRAGGVSALDEIFDNLELSDADYDYIQLIVNTMTRFNNMFIFAHYIKRPIYLAKLFDQNPPYSCEKPAKYRQRVSDMYYGRVGITKPTYNRYLREARYEFIMRGGMQ